MNDGTNERVEIHFPLSARISLIIDIARDEIDSWSEDIMKMFPYTASDGWMSSRADDVASWKETTLHVWREETSACPDRRLLVSTTGRNQDHPHG